MAEELDSDKIKDITDLLAEANNQKNLLGDITPINIFKTEISSTEPVVNELKSSLSSIPNIIKNVGDSFDSIKGIGIQGYLSEIKDQFLNWADAGNITKKQIIELGAAATGFVAVATKKIDMPKQITELGKSSLESNMQMSEMYKTILNIIPGGEALSKALDKAGVSIESAFSHADKAKAFELALLRNASSAGDLGQVLNSLDFDFENLTDKSIDYVNQMTDVANANNISFDSAVKMSGILRSIPGGLDQVVNSGDGAATQLNLMDAALKVSSGTFQDIETVTKEVNRLFRMFNMTGEDSLDIFANMHKAAMDMKMPFDIMANFVESTGEQFKFLGDNTQAAINIMGRFAPAWKDSGIGPEAMKNIVSGMVDATSKLDIAQRAFVSGRTGGPGGLQGGYQLALDMQMGNMDQVFSKVESTLRDMMGGQIVDLKQAATDPNAAAQMAKQVQMLTTGPLKMAGSEAEAFRIIEAFAQGQAPADMKGIFGEENALSTAIDTGNKIQEHQLNSLTMIHNEIQKQSVLAGLALNVQMQKGLGIAETGKDNIVKRKALENRLNAMSSASDRKIIEGEAKGNIEDEAIKLLSYGENVKDFVLSKFGIDNVPFFGNTASDVNQEESVDFSNLGTRKVQTDIAKGNDFVKDNLEEVREKIRRPDQPSTIIIKVMSDEKIENMIKVHINKFGEIIRSEELKSSYGSRD